MGNRTNQFVIGLTGSLGSGCTTISDALKEYDFTPVSLSKPIKDKFEEIHSCKPTQESFDDDWRRELQHIGKQGRKGVYLSKKKDDRGYWCKVATKGLPKGDIVIDGIRNKGEVEYLRNRFPNFWLVAVCASYEKRWDRIKDSGLYSDWHIFKRDDLVDSDEDDKFGQNVEKCVYEADYVVRNFDKLTPTDHRNETLSKKLLEQIKGMKGIADFRKPTPPEVFMATAVTQSQASQCIKRKVGALIVNEIDNIPISVGYNENPIGMQPCHLMYDGLCYKDKVLETKLEGIVPFYCPECGEYHKIVSKPWKCKKKNPEGIVCGCNFKKTFFRSRNIELCTAIHAEERAIRSLGGRSAEGATLYVNTFPCFQCARYIKDAGIRKVIYVEAYPISESKDFLVDNKIEIELFEGFKAIAFNKVFKQVE